MGETRLTALAGRQEGNPCQRPLYKDSSLFLAPISYRLSDLAFTQGKWVRHLLGAPTPT